MNPTTDAKTLSYINMFAILGSIEKLLEIDPAAADCLNNKKKIAVAFAVSGGPSCVMSFDDNSLKQTENLGNCDIKLLFTSPDKFNAMMDGKANPLPVKGFTKLSFMTKDFIAITNLLSKYLKATPEQLADDNFFEISTTLMFYVIAGAVAQIGNHDKIGKFSASNMADGDILFSIKNGPRATLTVKNGKLSMTRSANENPRAVMEFESMRLARDLFDGKVNALACIGKKQIVVSGMISMLDNMNRILDRVGLYLA